MRRRRIACTAFIVFNALCACQTGAPERILIAGSTTVLPIVSRAAERFQATHPDVRILVNAGGSGAGINLVALGKVQIGMSSRDITAAERARYPQADLVTYVIARDVVLPVVSSAIYQAGVRMLSREQLAKIYRGEIDNWKLLGGPDRPILVVDKEKARGTRHVFMRYVLGDPQAAAPGADLVLGSNNEEQTAVAQSDAAIGMLSYAWQNERVRGVALRLDDGSVIEPTRENIISGRYPIVRDLMLITAGRPEGDVAELIAYLASPESQQMIADLGYIRVDQNSFGNRRHLFQHGDR